VTARRVLDLHGGVYHYARVCSQDREHTDQHDRRTDALYAELRARNPDTDSDEWDKFKAYEIIGYRREDGGRCGQCRAPMHDLRVEGPIP